MSKLWKKNLKIGLNQLDKQNQEILALIEQYFNFCQDDSKSKEIFTIVKDLDRLMQHYFQEEEVIQVVFKYNKYEHHKHCHQKLLHMVEALQKLLMRFSPSSEVIQKANYMFYQAFCAHIQKEDNILARYVMIKSTSEYIESA